MTSPTAQAQTISYYKTNVGVFVRNLWGGAYNNYASSAHFHTYRFNGVQGKSNVTGAFMHMPEISDIVKVEKLQPATKKHVGYRLKSDYPLPITPYYTKEEVEEYWDDDAEETRFKNTEFDALCKLYDRVYEDVPEEWKEIEWKPDLLGEIHVENFTAPEKMQVKMIVNSSFASKTVEADLSSIVCYSDIERMLTPEFMLHTRPCSLTSSQVYSMVRHHIKENINPRAACITSDYDFCFTVKRKVTKPAVTTRTEIKKANGRSYATPKFKTQTTEHNLVELFEMTNSVDKYRGYTVIQGWQANSLQEMQEQVKYYLDTLMAEINTEYEVCQHCKGHGMIVTKIPTNQR